MQTGESVIKYCINKKYIKFISQDYPRVFPPIKRKKSDLTNKLFILSKTSATKKNYTNLPYNFIQCILRDCLKKSLLILTLS